MVAGGKGRRTRGEMRGGRQTQSVEDVVGSAGRRRKERLLSTLSISEEEVEREVPAFVYSAPS